MAGMNRSNQSNFLCLICESAWYLHTWGQHPCFVDSMTCKMNLRTNELACNSRDGRSDEER